MFKVATFSAFHTQPSQPDHPLWLMLGASSFFRFYSLSLKSINNAKKCISLWNSLTFGFDLEKLFPEVVSHLCYTCYNKHQILKQSIFHVPSKSGQQGAFSVQEPCLLVISPNVLNFWLIWRIFKKNIPWSFVHFKRIKKYK